MAKDFREKTICDICGENSSSEFMSMTNTIGRKLNICKKCSLREGLTVETEEEILSSIKLMPPQQIVEELDKRVVSHREAKVALSISIYSHLLRIKKKHKLMSMDKQIKKSNLLLTGVSGCGKTYLAQNIASIVNVPFTVYPVSSLSQPGYVGDDPENILLDLIRNADYNIKRAEKGIIFLDEIDKISRKSGRHQSISRDVSGEGVQSVLLPILEGINCTVPINGGRKHPQGTNYTINTSEILFLGGGAFEGIEHIVESRLHHDDKRPQIGFGVNCFKRSNYTIRELRNNITIDDLQTYGMMPELLGRFTNIIHLMPLDVSDLVSILKLPNGIVDEFKSYFYLHDKELTIEEDALHEIAEMAIRNSTGARGIRTILNEILKDLMFESPTDPHTTYYKIDRDFIKNINPSKMQMVI